MQEMSQSSSCSEGKAFLSLFKGFWCYPAALLWMELTLRLGTIGVDFPRGLYYTLGFTLAAGLFLYAIGRAFSPRVNRILPLVLFLVLTVFYMGQVVYYRIFTVFFTLFSVGGAGQVAQFGSVIWGAILARWWVLFLLLVPLCALIIWGRKLLRFDRPRWGAALYPLAACLLLQIITVCCVLLDGSGAMSPSRLYTTDFISNLSVSRFGMLTTFRIEMRNSIFGTLPALDFGEGSLLDEDGVSSDAPPQTLPIDFDALIADCDDATLRGMHEYFASVTPSVENEYTGRFAGKNLIFMTCESLWKYAIDEELTPTLYKLYQEGFQFTSFYNPLWDVSTLDGEYVNCLGLLPVTGTWSFNEAAKNVLPFALGNQFGALGYTARAYHDHTYNYYNRDLSHPQMGYLYKGLGNGLNVTASWPESDLEMMQKTVDEYIHDEQFHVYYMTVSGHLEYNFFGNEMAMKHSNLVQNIDLPEAARAYLACNIELDRALQYLLERLEAAGLLEDTVIALCPDHYPYGLDTESLNALAGHTLNTDYELYQSCFLLWCGDMAEPVLVEKPVSSLDILPTLSNLFDLPYDSRLLMGRDMLSPDSSPVIFSDHSWLTEYGYYSAAGDTYTAFSETENTEDTIARTNRLVEEKFKYSKLILRQNYYDKVLPVTNTE